MRGSELKKLREERGIKQKFIAETVLGGVTPASVCIWEKTDCEIPPMASKLLELYLKKRRKVW